MSPDEHIAWIRESTWYGQGPRESALALCDAYEALAAAAREVVAADDAPRTLRMGDAVDALHALLEESS